MNDWRPGRFLGPATFVEVISRRAKYQADELLFTFLTDGETEEAHLTYSELDRQARAIAAQLQELGLEGERALLLYPAGLDFIAAFFGCLYAGVVAVTAYPPRMNRSLGRIDAIVADAGAKIALTTAAVRSRIDNNLEQTPDLQRLLWLETDSLPAGVEANWRRPEIDSETLAFLQYTSGSTGTPKGVMLTHGNLINNSALISYGFDHGRGNGGVFWLPSYHDMGLVGGILQPAFIGRHNVLMSPMAFLQKPLRWLRAISKYRATTSGGPNFAYDLCVRKIRPEDRAELDLSSWRVAFNGAEPVRHDTLAAFVEAFRPCGFDPRAFYPCYGMAEATLIVTGGRAFEGAIVRDYDARLLDLGEAVAAARSEGEPSGDERPADEEPTRALVSSGARLPDMQTIIVDPQSLRLLREGQIGEIWAQGPSIAQGYWNRDEESAQTFRARPLDDDGQPIESLGHFLRTGDLGFFDQGELFVTGRIKDLIIVHGVNHYPQDVEMTMERSHSALRPHTAAAFAVETPGGAKLVVVQEVERTRRHECPEIIEAIRQAIARHHDLVADAIVLIKPGSVPKTSSGKIQRFACRQEFLKGTLAVLDQWQLGDAPRSARREHASPATGRSTDKITTHAVLAAATASQANGTAHAPSTNGNGSHANGSYANGKQAAKLIRKDGAAAVVRPEPSSERGGDSHPPAQSPPAERAQVALEPPQVLAAVIRLTQQLAGQRAEHIAAATSLAELGLDSLERIELQTLIEEHFGGRIPEEVGPTLDTIQDIVDAVLLYLGQPTARESRAEITPDKYRFDQFPECAALRERLAVIDDSGLSNPFFRTHEQLTDDKAVIGGREFINFSSFNYIGMAGDPVVSAAAKRAIDRYGNSVSASRLVSGEKVLHRELEEKLAQLHGTDDAIVYPAGHSTNVNTVGHLFGPGDLILYDALAHNSIVTGANLSGAKRRPFPHNDWRTLDRLLTDLRHNFRRVLVAIEGAYSMDGDIADMPGFVELKHKHKVNLLVDEAHSVGVLGTTGRGVAELFGLAPSDVD
ncbi:MAG: aminotransferase class I/II-fold pyridoxal phosphate-dependent enzyme, partial [Planctomycetaceae bacterium]|nr:aminotransferase class I/II-fold pyridoxal phosphate-dependent enzyme [Planctomycetaceae bacterium]